VIQATLYDPSSKQLTSGGTELIGQWARSPEAEIWVVLGGESTESDRSLLAEHFKIHPLAIADALRDRHPPKIEAFSNSTFILLKALDAVSSSLELGTVQLSIFLGERFLVTRSSGRSVSTEGLLADLKSGVVAPETGRPGLALLLCRRVFDRFLPVLLAVEDRLDEMEADLLAKPSDDLLADLLQQKGDLKRFLRLAQYHHQVFSEVQSHLPRELDAVQHQLNDVREQIERQLSLARLYYELTDDLMNGYLSLSAHRLNGIMQTLTIVTVIFVPITFMAGIYGMNFEFIPELGFRHGYFVLLGVMLVVVASILFYFRRRGWLRGS